MQLNSKSQHKHQVGKKIHGFEQELLFVQSSEKVKRRNCLESTAFVCLYVCVEA